MKFTYETKVFIKSAIVICFQMICTQNLFGQFKTYDKVFDFDKNGLARVCNNYESDNQLMGIIDETGREIVPLKYYDVSVSDNNIAIVTEAGPEGEKGMKALVDLKTGKEITPFKWIWIDGFENGLAFAETEKGNEVIDSNGKALKKTNIEDAEYLGDNFILKPTDEGVMFYNLDGKLISNKIFKDAYHFDDKLISPKRGWIQVWTQKTNTDSGFDNRFSHWLNNKGELLTNDEYLLKVKKEKIYIEHDKELNEMMVYSNENGTVLTSFKADACRYSADVNRIIAKSNNKYAILDVSGKKIFECDFVYNNFQEDRLLVRYEDNKEWFVNSNGDKIIDYTNKFANYRYETSIRVDNNGKSLVGGVINKKPYFCEGLVCFRDNNKVGFINKSGDIVIPAQYKNVGPYNNGYAIVQDIQNEKYGIIDVTGKIIIPCKYQACSYNSNGYIVVTDNQYKQSFIKLTKDSK